MQLVITPLRLAGNPGAFSAVPGASGYIQFQNFA